MANTLLAVASILLLTTSPSAQITTSNPRPRASDVALRVWILPHSGNLYRDKVSGAIFVGNGFGKLAGFTQVDEMGDIETPILLTNTTSVPQVADAITSYTLNLPGNEEVLSVNP